MYSAKNFDRLLGTPGFSDRMLKDHFTLYQGYVKNTNQLIETLGSLAKEGKEAAPEFAELKRRFGWEFNGMRLHEYYFGNMKKEHAPFSENSELGKKMKSDFGSFAAWEKDFKAVGAMRGIGWAALYHDVCGDRLLNVWINEHDAGHLAGQPLILIMDVFEHAFLTDYGLKRKDYIDAFFKVLDWQEVENRFTATLEHGHAHRH